MSMMDPETAIEIGETLGTVSVAKNTMEMVGAHSFALESKLMSLILSAEVGSFDKINKGMGIGFELCLSTREELR